MALAHSGLEWTGKFANAGEGGWKALKPSTPWGETPILEGVPGVGTIGHELTILQYIAKRAGPALEGADEKEWLTSMQIMSEAEDIYAKLGKLKVPPAPRPALAREEGLGHASLLTLCCCCAGAGRTAGRRRTTPSSGRAPTRPSTTATRASPSTSPISSASTARAALARASSPPQGSASASANSGQRSMCGRTAYIRWPGGLCHAVGMLPGRGRGGMTFSASYCVR